MSCMKKKKKKKVKKKIKLFQLTETEKQENIIRLLTIALVVVVFMLLLLFFYQRNKKKADQLLTSFAIFIATITLDQRSGPICVKCFKSYQEQFSSGINLYTCTDSTLIMVQDLSMKKLLMILVLGLLLTGCALAEDKKF